MRWSIAAGEICEIRYAARTERACVAVQEPRFGQCLPCGYSDVLSVAPRRWLIITYAGQGGRHTNCHDVSRNLCTQRAFELLLGPFDHVIELLVALRELRHHHGIDGLVVHLSADFGTRRRAEHRGLLVAAWRIAVDHALRRLDGLPGIEVVHALERRQVVADRGRDQLSDRLLLRHVQQEILGRRFVLRKAPQAIELRKLTDVTTLWPTRHGVQPDIFCNLRIVALGDGPRAWRVHDARAFAGDDPAIVAGIVPGVDLRRIHRHELLEILHHFAGFVRVDLDVVLVVDHDDAEGLEQRADPVDRVAGLTHRQPDGIAGFMQFLRGIEIEIPGPQVRLGFVVFRLVGGEHVDEVDAAVFLVEVEARLTRLDLAADRGWYATPCAFDLGQIFGDRADRAILLYELIDHVVEWFEQARMDLNIPVAVRHDVMACAGLRFGRSRQFVLLSLRRDVIDMDVDFVLVAPFLADLIKGLIGTGHPVIPTTQGERAGSVNAADIGCGNDRCRTEGGGLENGTT